MRRSICLSEPSVALAGQVSTWKFSYSSAVALPKGTCLKFDMLFKGRPVDWEIPQSNLKVKKNLIWATLANRKIIQAKEVFAPDSLAPHFEFVLPEEVKAGDPIEIFMGTPEARQEDGTRAQMITQRRRPFHLYIDPKGKGDYKEPEIFNVDIRGNVLKNIRIIVPSMVSKNRRFDVLVRFEDQFGNLTSYAPDSTLIELSYEHLRENLNWKLFVPETGFIVLPNLYFNEPGIYKIQLLNTNTKEKFYSTPIKCFGDSELSLYWGLLHGESEKVDAEENIETCLRHNRDEKSLQYFATSPFESIEETSNEIWKTISQQVAEFNEESRFVSFLGFQWHGDEDFEGLRQLIYWKDGKPILRKKDSKNSNLKKIYKGHTPKELLSIPSFSMAKGYETSFEDFAPEFERVVEIYNAWGCSECTQKEGNLRPITAKSKNGIFESEVGSIRKALNRNCRFGFVAGGLDDRGIYQSLFKSDQVQYSPGLTAIIAGEQTREALLHALYNRFCYATTGDRIVLGFSIAGAHMGSELNTKAKPGLSYNRHITGFVCGTSVIKEITIIRNGTTAHTMHPNNSQQDFVWDDSELLSDINLTSPDERPPFTYYYLRVVQENGHIAWSSPIWIDFLESKPSASLKKSKKG